MNYTTFIPKMSPPVGRLHQLWFYIYGFNFAIVAGLFVGFLGWPLGRWRWIQAAFLGIALYAILAGASAGVVRAAIMGGLKVFLPRLRSRYQQLALKPTCLSSCLLAQHTT